MDRLTVADLHPTLPEAARLLGLRDTELRAWLRRELRIGPRGVEVVEHPELVLPDRTRIHPSQVLGVAFLLSRNLSELAAKLLGYGVDIASTVPSWKGGPARRAIEELDDQIEQAFAALGWRPSRNARHGDGASTTRTIDERA